MILITILMGGLILSATAIAGLLMFYQLQQTSNTAASGMAIFAADAATESALESYYHGTPISVPPQNSNIAYYQTNVGPFTNGAQGSAAIYFNFTGIAGTCSGSGTSPIGFCVVATGISGATERGLQSYFSMVQ